MPDTVDTVIWAPDDGWRYHPKHVKQFTDKNKLYIFASCWIIIDIYHTLHGPMNVKYVSDSKKTHRIRITVFSSVPKWNLFNLRTKWTSQINYVAKSWVWHVLNRRYIKSLLTALVYRIRQIQDLLHCWRAMYWGSLPLFLALSWQPDTRTDSDVGLIMTAGL